MRVLHHADHQDVALSETDRETLRRLALASVMAECLPAEDIKEAQAIIARCRCPEAPAPAEAADGATHRPHGWMGWASRGWVPDRARLREMARHCAAPPAVRHLALAAGLGAAVVSTTYLLTANQRMMDDFQQRAAAATDLAQKCLAAHGGNPSYTELVALQTRIFEADAEACPKRSPAAPKPVAAGIRQS